MIGRSLCFLAVVLHVAQAHLTPTLSYKTAPSLLFSLYSFSLCRRHSFHCTWKLTGERVTQIRRQQKSVGLFWCILVTHRLFLCAFVHVTVGLWLWKWGELVSRISPPTGFSQPFLWQIFSLATHRFYGEHLWYLNGCSARDWERSGLLEENSQSGCSDICASLKGPL